MPMLFLIFSLKHSPVSFRFEILPARGCRKKFFLLVIILLILYIMAFVFVIEMPEVIQIMRLLFIGNLIFLSKITEKLFNSEIKYFFLLHFK